jgi:hypothetical protein
MKGSVKMVAWSLALAIGLLGLAQASGLRSAAAAPVLAQADDPVAVVDAFHAAGDNMDAALALLTDDVVLGLRPPPPNSTGIWKGKGNSGSSSSGETRLTRGVCARATRWW